MKVFYHRGDLDGKASGAIIKKRYPEAELIGAEYGDNVDEYIAMVTPGEKVVVVDYTFEPFHKMLELANKADLTWIDHHWSAIKEFKEHDSPFDAYVGDEKNEKGACELAWEWCNPHVPVPSTVRYLSLYDVWKHKDSPDILAFQFGARYELPSVDSAGWILFLAESERILHQVHDEYTSVGRILLRYQAQNSKSMAREFAFEREFEGYKAIIMNSSSKGSGLFKTVKKAGHQLMIVFCMTSDQKWKFSVYSEDPTIDCGAICKRYGGGGHKGAAGFTSETLPWQN